MTSDERFMLIGSPSHQYVRQLINLFRVFVIGPNCPLNSDYLLRCHMPI